MHTGGGGGRRAAEAAEAAEEAAAAGDIGGSTPDVTRGDGKGREPQSSCSKAASTRVFKPAPSSLHVTTC